MPTIYQLPIQVPGMVEVFPNQKFAVFGDDLTTVTTAGYLNQVNLESNPISKTDILQVLYSFNNVTKAGTYGVFTVSISNSGVITLNSWANPGDVLLPVVSNRIAQFNGTTGQIYDGTATATHAGSIQAGVSGTAGTLISFPATAANGTLIISALNAGGAFNTTIRNSVMGQSSVISIPDPGAATANFLLNASASGQTISGGLTLSTGNLGVTLGNITAAAGNIAATLGSVSAGTTVTGGTGVTATTGNVTASAGNVVAGASGAAGTHISFPSTAANGTLILAAANAGGAFNTTISNGTMAQSTVYTIPDVTAATGQFLAKTSAFVNGNLIQASGTAGVTVDSGVATTNVQLKTQVVAARTANIGGGGAGPISVVVAGLTAASIVTASIQASTNTVSVSKVTATATGFDILFSADPGATCTVNYIAYIAAQ